ncbi:MAG: hypothetical protein DWQ34_25935 [Planctomycetota bacterium]|nr:MAG: hypothetical protein DWQ34_25935 [Planctomycetota bacterium]REK25845.1 MAG: hypothetical protein DWQ41_11030 [Planctomycetota bacterium]REK37124.1 MAG: hypothetical protein DWQ45_07840 [Planctomycetota bacterium]
MIVIDTLVVVGGAIGSYCYVRKIRGPQERTFVVKMFVLMWLLIIGLFAGQILFPGSAFLLFIPYAILLTPLALYWNKKQREIHIQESGSHRGDDG